MKKLRCVIFANGDMDSYSWAGSLLRSDDYIICADGGLRHVEKLGLTADVIVGDMDSVNDNILGRQLEKGAKLLQYPRDKDEPDTELAISHAIRMQPSEICILGATGSRLDHSLASIHLLVPVVTDGIKGEILDQNHRITLVTPDCPVILKNKRGQAFSLLPLTTKVTGVTTTGVQWPLTNAVFYLGKPYGISNYCTESESRITIEDGIVVLIEYNNKQ